MRHYLFLISVFFLMGCNLNNNSVNFNKDTIKQSMKKSRILNITLSDTNFKKMSFNEFDLFLKNYSNNSKHPNINN